VLDPEDADYIERIAWRATQGMVGHDVAIPHGELHDVITQALEAIAERAYRRGVEASMVQLSLDPGMARVVG
jgi:mannitol/fructose-specific phosphotransferase system IIA component